MKNRRSSIFLLLIMLAGLALMLYPAFSSYWNAKHQTRYIEEYADSVSDRADELERLSEAARQYNCSLLERGNPYLLNEEQAQLYDSLLDTNGTGIMGYISIPDIAVELPIYHGVDKSVLQIGVGHLPWSFLPIGGEGTHCVLTAHRGLTTARLFSDLDKLTVGSRFTIHVLDETLTYEVEEILVVEPDDTSSLLIQEGEDLCTLVTCTPYGINTHRLLVRGRRTETPEAAETAHIAAGARLINPLYTAMAIALPLLVIVYSIWILLERRRH